MVRRKPFEILATFSIFLTVAFAVAVVFAPVNTSDAKTHKATHGKAYVASISSEDAVGIKVVPTNAQKTFSGNHKIAYSNTCPYGFSVSMSSSSENTSMVAEIRGKTATIPSISKAASALSDNTWGYSTDGGKTYNPIPSLKSPVTLVSLASEAAGANVDVTFAVKTNNKTKAGDYSGDIIYTVSAKPACLEYTLKWNLNGGKVGSQTGSYNETYVSFSDLFNLKNYTPTRTGYDFKGWSNGKQSFTGSETSVDINPDNLQSITMTAQWQPTKYTISYNLDGGTASGNPTNYTIETAAIKLNNPTKDGYNFVGWTGSNGTTPAMDVTIANGSTGNKSYTANWEEAASDYTITYDLRGGTLDTPNPSSYSSEDPNFTLNVPTKSSRTFVEWVCTDTEGRQFASKDAFSDLEDDLVCSAYYSPTKAKKFGFEGSKTQSWTVPEDGFYKIVAKGGDGHPNTYNNESAGRGGSVTYDGVFLKGGTVLYVTVGEGGWAPSKLSQVGYNGGGRLVNLDSHYKNGGGATHIATKDGVLSKLSSAKSAILVVAGGGGGGSAGNEHDTAGYHGGDGCAGPFSGTFGQSPCGTSCYNMGSGGGYYGGQTMYGGGACYIKGKYTPKANGQEKNLPIKSTKIGSGWVRPIGCANPNACSVKSPNYVGYRYKDVDDYASIGYTIAVRSDSFGQNGSASIEFLEYAIEYPEVTE